MVFKALVAAFWLLVVGMCCVFLELTEVRLGHRVHQRQKELAEIEERLRRLEVEYMHLVTPDRLEQDLGDLFEVEHRSTLSERSRPDV